jgi:hypothetical protein
MLDNLPEEILLNIFSSFDWKTLLIIHLLNKYYATIEGEYANNLWKKFLNNRCQKTSKEAYKLTFFTNPLARKEELIFIDKKGEIFREALEKTKTLLAKTPLASEKTVKGLLEFLSFKTEFLTLDKYSLNYPIIFLYYDHPIFVNHLSGTVLESFIEFNAETISPVFKYLNVNNEVINSDSMNFVIRKGFKKDSIEAIRCLDLNLELAKHCDQFFKKKIEKIRENPPPPPGRVDWKPSVKKQERCFIL